MRQLLEITLRKEGYRVTMAESGKKAVEAFGKAPYDLVISDIKMPDMSGVDVLREVKQSAPETPVIMITAYSSAETAVDALRLGAYDYIAKPFKVDELKVTIKNALEKTRLTEEVVSLKRALRQKHGLGSLLGRSPKMIKLFELIKSVAPTNSTVLITGESGTGKELAARAIHTNSTRQAAQFVSVNCGAVPETLLESELFGHLRGSFTGATANHKGLFEVAHQGTIFLDEIAEMSPSMQVKLLRVLQDKTFRSIGSTEEIEVDVRIIAATNKELEKVVAEKAFREDLYYRLNVIPIHMPPLRERRDDIEMLAEHFLAKASAEMGKKIAKISDEAMKLMTQHDWPGNVRELENVIERAVALESSQVILPERLPDKIQEGTKLTLAEGGGQELEELPEEGIDFHRHVDSIEKRLLSLALARAGGVQTKAAKFLHMNLRSFRYLLQKYDLR
jgi:two-component system response regulator PilR (NtrC family)